MNCSGMLKEIFLESNCTSYEQKNIDLCVKCYLLSNQQSLNKNPDSTQHLSNIYQKSNNIIKYIYNN